MITVTYNNVVLENVLTRDFRQEVVYDRSNTDPFFSRYTLRFEGLITTLPQGPRVLANYAPQGSLPHGTWNLVRQALLDPRHTLEVRGLFHDDQGNLVNKVLFRCVPERLAPQDPDRDLGHGPQPRALELIGSLASRALKVSWEVQCEKMDWPVDPGAMREHFEGGQGSLQTVLDNRWTIDEQIDANFFMTRAIRGSLRLSRPVARAGWDYRWLAVPPLEAGFQRQQMSYAVMEDGLVVEYQITDRQVHTAAPWPATSMHVRNSKSTQLGATYMGSCEVTLAGPPHIPRKALVIRAVQILDALTQFISNAQELQDKFSFLPVNITLTEEIGPDNVVVAHIEYTFAPGAGLTDQEQEFFNEYRTLGKDLDLSGQPWPIPGLGTPPMEAYDPNVSWIPSPWGYNTWEGERPPALSAIFQCYLQRPYHPWHAMGWWPAPENPPEEPIRPEVTEFHGQRGEAETSLYPNTESKYSPSHTQAMYTYARAKTLYRLEKGLRQLERTDTAPDGSTAVVFRIGCGRAIRIHVVDAERIGQPPELPPPDDYVDANGVNGYLARWTVECLPAVPSPAGDLWVYRMRARYVYYLDRLPPTHPAARPWPVGRIPFAGDAPPGWDPNQSWSARLGPNPEEPT